MAFRHRGSTVGRPAPAARRVLVNGASPRNCAASPPSDVALTRRTVPSCLTYLTKNENAQRKLAEKGMTLDQSDLQRVSDSTARCCND